MSNSAVNPNITQDELTPSRHIRRMARTFAIDREQWWNQRGTISGRLGEAALLAEQAWLAGWEAKGRVGLPTKAVSE